MGRVTVKLSVGDGRIRTLGAQLNSLNRELERVYQQGQSNDNTVSNRDLTNLQKHFGAFNQATSDKKDSLVQELQQAQLGGDSRQINHIASQIEQLVEAQRASDQFFNGLKYKQINSYRVSSSKRFADSQYADYNDDFSSRLSDLSHDIGFNQNREKILNNRWNTSARAGVMSAERYKSYQDYSSQLDNTLNGDAGLSKRLDALKEENERELQNTIQQRKLEQHRINGGDFSRSTARAGLDEQIKQLRRYRTKIEELTTTLKKLNNDYKTTVSKIDSASPKDAKTGKMHYDNKNASIIIKSPKGSLKGLIRDHKRVLVRASLAAAVAGFSQSLSAGSNIRLNTFDDVKATAYARGGKDNHVENVLSNAGYKNLGYDEESMARYLNSFTSSTGNANLSDKQITNLTQAWGGLSRYSGAKESTTQNLEMIAGLTASYKSPGASATVANAIQNSITNSKMSAKADEQQSALASLYQFAGQGQSLTADDQKNLAGFQANMAKMGSDMQGQNGVQAYKAMASALSDYDDPTARALFGGFDPQYRTPHGQAALLEKMQNAKKDPSQYQTPIKNMLAHARREGAKTPAAQRQVAAMGLVEESHNQLSMDQAEKLIKLEQEGKFSKKAARKAVKGNGKGQKDKYDLTSTKGLHKYLAAYHNMQRQTSDALDLLRKAAARFDQSLWVAPIIGGAIKGALSSLAFQILPDIYLRDIWKVIRHPKQSYRVVKDMIKHPGDISKNVLRDNEEDRKASHSIVHTVGEYVKRKSGKYAETAKSLLRRTSGIRSLKGLKILKKIPLLGTLFTASDLKHGDFIGALDDSIGSLIDPLGLLSIFTDGKNKKNANREFSDLLHGRFRKLRRDSERTERDQANGHAYRSLLGSYYTDKDGKQHFRLFNYSRKTPSEGRSRLKSHLRRTTHKEAHNSAKHRERSSRIRLGKRGKLGLGIAGGLALGSYLFSGNEEASDRYGNSGLNVLGGGTTLSTTYRKMLNKIIIKRKYLHTSEWELIKYLNDYWDIFLRKVKESGGSSDDDKDKDAGNVSDDGASTDENYWRKKIKEVAKALHQNVTDAQVDAILGVIRGESGFNEKAKGGTDGLSDGPALGLLQFKQGTFNTYAAKGHHNIMSGVDQLYAFFNIKNWPQYATGHAGWSPTGPTNGFEVGGIHNHATGGNFSRTVLSNTSTSSVDPKALTDLRTVAQMTTIRKPVNYIKPVRNKPKFEVKIKVNQSTGKSRSQIIDETINSVFSNWLAGKQQQSLHYYYQNETSGQFI